MGICRLVTISAYYFYPRMPLRPLSSSDMLVFTTVLATFSSWQNDLEFFSEFVYSKLLFFRVFEEFLKAWWADLTVSCAVPEPPPQIELAASSMLELETDPP